MNGAVGGCNISRYRVSYRDSGGFYCQISINCRPLHHTAQVQSAETSEENILAHAALWSLMSVQLGTEEPPTAAEQPGNSDKGRARPVGLRFKIMRSGICCYRRVSAALFSFVPPIMGVYYRYW